ncbi:hypothetical protein [Sphingomonas sp.]|uniref:hypothetical protein n=1 Tax=Sphingomonas sp. TaxID=28214 RepID=UPI002D7E1B95|nr:hypothetical protein [Sphingomonas sp.]
MAVARKAAIAMARVVRIDTDRLTNILSAIHPLPADSLDIDGGADDGYQKQP